MSLSLTKRNRDIEPSTPPFLYWSIQAPFSSSLTTGGDLHGNDTTVPTTHTVNTHERDEEDFIVRGIERIQYES